MQKQCTAQGDTQYFGILPEICNNTKHGSITPTQASKEKNEGIVYFNLYGDAEPSLSKLKFKVGNKVRISKYKRKVFEKGMTQLD